MAYNDEIGFVMDNRPLFRGGVKKQTISADTVLDGKSEVFNLCIART